MVWDVQFSSEFEVWYRSLTAQQQDLVLAGAVVLGRVGPNAGRPWVDTLSGKLRYHNLKELRLPGTNLRVLFIFDPRRVAVLLYGGDKSGEWTKWYRTAIPLAETIYTRHLAELEKENMP